MTAQVVSMWDAEREPWWHGMGGKFANVTNKRLTPREAVKAAGLSPVEKRPLYAYLGAEDEPSEVGDFTPLPSHDSYALVRKQSKRMLSIVKRRFQVIQPLEQAEFLITLIDAGDLVLVSGGSLVEPGLVDFFCAQLPKDVKIGGLKDEVIEQYVTFLNPHGRGAAEIFGSGIRSVCMNTVHMGLAQAKGIQSYWRLTHDETWVGRVAEAREALSLVYEQSKEFKAFMESLLDKGANERTVKKVFEAVWPVPEADTKSAASWKVRYDQIHTVWATSPNLENVRGTQYGVFNAFSEWAEHGRRFYGTGGDPDKQAAKRGEEVLLGRTREIEEKAVEALLHIPGVKAFNLAKAGKRKLALVK